MIKFKFYISLFYLSTTIGLFSCCHTGKIDAEESNIVIEIIKLDSWLNLMPGDAAKFHLAGEASIYSESKIKDFKFFFQTIKVSQNKTQLYSFSPVVNLLSEELNTEKIKVYKIEFYTDSGLPINSSMNSDKNIDIEFIFSTDLNMKNIFLADVKLEKAY